MLSDTIEITRGDTKYFSVIKQDEDGNKVPFESGAKVSFSVKRNYNSTEYVIHKESTDIVDGEILIKLDPEDTDVALNDNYYYDFQYTTVDNEIYTLVKGTAQVVWEVTN